MPKVVKTYNKIDNGKPVEAQIIQYNNGFTVISSNMKEDKDFSDLQECESYLKSKGYKIMDSKDRLFTVKHKNRNFVVVAKNHKDAATKVVNKINQLPNSKSTTK